MKLKSLLLTLVTLVATLAMAQTNTWNEQLSIADGTSTTSCPYNIVNGYDGSFFTLANYLTTGSEAEINFFGFTLPQTTVSSATNQNLVLVKHDIDGNADWAVYSTGGNIDTGNTVFVPTQDGGVLMIIKARHKEKNADGSNILVSLKSSNGSEKSVMFDYATESGSADYHWIYQPALAKIDGNGNIVSLKRAYASWTVPAEQEGTVTESDEYDVFSFYAAATDGNDNMYVAAAMTNDLTFGSETVHHQSLGSNKRKNGVVLKFDSDLNLAGYVSSTGDNTSETISGIVYGNGSLYTMGVVETLGAELSFGGKSVASGSVSGTPNLWVAKINPETLQASNLTVLENKGYNNGSKLLYTTKLNNLTISNNSEYLYVCGALIGEFDLGGGKSIAPGSDKQMGFTVRFNCSDATVNNGFDIADETSLISQVISVIDNTDSIYVWGYDMTKNGVKFESRDRTTLAKKKNYNLYSNTNAQTTVWPCFAVSGSKILLPLRAKTLVTPVGAEQAYGNTRNFYALISGFDFGSDIDFSKNGSEPTSVQQTSDAGQNAIIYAQGGNIYVCGAEGEDIAIYSVAGIQVARVASAPQNAIIPVSSKGLYIVKTKSKTQKLLVNF